MRAAAKKRQGMKFYVHLETSRLQVLPEATLPCKLQDPTAKTVADVCAWFAREYTSKYVRLKEGSFVLVKGDGRVLQPSANISDVIKDREDVFVRPVNQNGVVAKDEECEVRENNAQEAANGCAEAPPPSEIMLIPDPAPIPLANGLVFTGSQYMRTTNEQPEAIDVLAEAAKAYSLKQYKLVLHKCEQYIDIMGERTEDAIVLIAQSLFDAGRYMESAKGFAEARALGVTERTPTYVIMEGRCYSAVGEYEDAIVIFQDALAMLEETDAKRPPDPKTVKSILDARAHMAEAMFELGHHQAAAAIVNQSLNVNENHLPSLLAYSYFARSYCKAEDAMRGLLKAIVLEQSNKRARRLLAKVLKADVGLENLLSQLTPNPSTATAYAFLATICKDHSAIQTSIELLRRGLALNPTSASYMLNITHDHEVLNRYDDALIEATRFLGDNATLRVGTRGFTAGQLYDVLHPVVSNFERAARAPPKWGVTWHKVGKDESYGVFHRLAKVSGSGQLAEYEKDDPEQVEIQKETYDDASLDLLALGFALVKLLFVRGLLAPIPELARIIEQTRRNSQADLHLTTIRNEQAYHSCILQVLAERSAEAGIASVLCSPLTSPRFTDAARRPLYICGDSHTISSAWSTITVRGEQRLLIPKLVTGIKHWHLRTESDFYPKENFYRVVKSIPPKSEVVFVIGEIDCREGILLAVERHKYNSVQEGMIHTVEIFMDVLKRLVSQFKFRVYIHPIIPVLNETRSIVTVYNALYHHRITSRDMQRLGIEWLDFFDDLLTPQGLLRPDFELDATHLHPRYTALIEREMNRVVEKNNDGASGGGQLAGHEWLPGNNGQASSAGKKKGQKKGKK